MYSAAQHVLRSFKRSRGSDSMFTDEHKSDRRFYDDVDVFEMRRIPKKRKHSQNQFEYLSSNRRIL